MIFDNRVVDLEVKNIIVEAQKRKINKMPMTDTEKCLF